MATSTSGIPAAGLFLLRHGVRLTASNVELEQFTSQVARSEVPLEQMVSLKRHSGRNA